ncbi:MAG: glycosyltransferase family 1 protein [Kiritimatiellia bacterium]
MIIGVDAREFTGTGKTGIGRYLENLLAPLVRKGDNAFVLFTGRAESIPPSLVAPSVKIVPLPSLPAIVLDEAVLPALARRENIDLFFSPYYKIPLSGPFKRIITVHDIMFLRRNDLSRLARAAVGRRLLASGRRADIVLVDSDFTGGDLALFAPGLRPKIQRLYPDLAAAWLEPVDVASIAAARKRFALDGPLLLYTGNFKPHKNVDSLVEAFARIDGNKPRLVLAGGDERNSLRIEKLIRDRGLAARATVIRDINDEVLRALYAAADWFITASEYEGFGYPALEAMASGCPVICRTCTSLPEVVGKAAVEIKTPGAEGITEALRRAFAMPAAEKAGRAASGRERAEMFAPGSAAAGFARILGAIG